MLSSNEPFVIFNREDAIDNFSKGKTKYDDRVVLDRYLKFKKTGQFSNGDSHWLTENGGASPRVYNYLLWADKYIFDSNEQFNTHNNLFPLINELCIRGIFGHLGKKKILRVKGPMPLIQRINDEVEKIEVSPIIYYPDENKKITTPLIDLGVYLGRVIQNMGAPLSPKRTNFDEWPEYFKHIDEQNMLTFARVIYGKLSKKDSIKRKGSRTHTYKKVFMPAVEEKDTAETLILDAIGFVESVIDNIEIGYTISKTVTDAQVGVMLLRKDQVALFRETLVDKLFINV